MQKGDLAGARIEVPHQRMQRTQVQALGPPKWGRIEGTRRQRLAKQGKLGRATCRTKKVEQSLRPPPACPNKDGQGGRDQGGNAADREGAPCGRDCGGWIGRRVEQQGGQCHNGDTARVKLATAPLLCPQGRQRCNCDDGNGARATQGMTPVSPRQRWHKCAITTTAMAPAPRRQQCTLQQPRGRQHCNGNNAQATMAMVPARQ